MKNRLISMIALVLSLCLFTGCTGTTVVIGNCTCPTEEANVASPVPATGNNLKVGLACVASASEKDGESGKTLSFDVTVAAVTVDEAGVILSCTFDSLNPSVNVGETDITAHVVTKTELGEAYGMKNAGSKYEWYEQAAAVAEYAVGKTADELKNGTFSETGAVQDADLASTASIYIGGYVNAIIAAANNAQALGAEAGDELAFAVIPAVTYSEGTIQLDCDMVAMTMNGDIITSCYIDSLQAKVPVDENGNVTIPESFPTKNELKEDYGMKAIAYAKYEWYEQAANFANYVTGKTVADVNGIAINEQAKPTKADLATSVTISIDGFQALLAKAVK